MAERLSEDEVRHVANLARLDVTDEEVTLYAGQLSDFLQHAQDVEALNLDEIPPTTHALPITNVFREDVAVPGLDRDVVLAEAPAAESGRFRVPRILGEEP